MASMGDDQEENIEMWKIKKVLHMCIEFVPFSFTYFYSFVMREFSFAPADETREKAPRRRRKRCDGVFFFSRLKALPFECALFNPDARVVAFEY
jgi:hypothetical protein